MTDRSRRTAIGLAAIVAALLAIVVALLLAPAFAGRCSADDLVCRYATSVAPSVLLNLVMALSAIGAGVVIGFAIGWGRVSERPALRALARGYTEAIRGTPLLIQIFIVFFTFPALNIWFGEIGVGLRLDVPPIQRVIIALTINTSAYQGEIFRAGFQSIARGQLDAARSVGMTRWQAMRHVVIPQALRSIAPPLTNEYVIMFKDATPIAFIVAGSAVPELVQSTRTFKEVTQATVESFLLAALVFVILSLMLMAFLKLLERRFAVPGLGISVRQGG